MNDPCNVGEVGVVALSPENDTVILANSPLPHSPIKPIKRNVDIGGMSEDFSLWTLKQDFDKLDGNFLQEGESRKLSDFSSDWPMSSTWSRLGQTNKPTPVKPTSSLPQHSEDWGMYTSSPGSYSLEHSFNKDSSPSPPTNANNYHGPPQDTWGGPGGHHVSLDSFDNRDLRESLPPVSNTISVDGLSDVREIDLRKFFERFGPVKSLGLYGRQGNVQVTYHSAADAYLAMTQLNGRVIGKRLVSVIFVPKVSNLPRVMDRAARRVSADEKYSSFNHPYGSGSYGTAETPFLDQYEDEAGMQHAHRNYMSNHSPFDRVPNGSIRQMATPTFSQPVSDPFPLEVPGSGMHYSYSDDYFERPSNLPQYPRLHLRQYPQQRPAIAPRLPPQFIPGQQNPSPSMFPGGYPGSGIRGSIAIPSNARSFSGDESFQYSPWPPQRGGAPSLQAASWASQKSICGASPIPALNVYMPRTLNFNGKDRSPRSHSKDDVEGACRRVKSGENDMNYSKYEMNIEKVLTGNESRTTLMIKNIPNKYGQKMLLAAVDKNHKGTYDFFYLPIDFKNKCNVGYAFINFINVRSIVSFYHEFNDKKWEKFNSEKVCQIAFARIQGKVGAASGCAVLVCAWR